MRAGGGSVVDGLSGWRFCGGGDLAGGSYNPGMGRGLTWHRYCGGAA